MFEAQDVLFDYRDFEELNRAIETGKANSYNQGYADGLANQPSINAKVTYTFHHHDTGNGDPTEVSFTQEEIDNGTRDAWFASHPVPASMTTSKGEYTVYHSDRIPKYEICNGDREPKGSYCQCPRCGATYPISQYGHGNCTARIITGYTYNNYYTPSSGRNEKELIRVSVELN